MAFETQLRKDNPNDSEEYTDPVLGHKQVLLKAYYSDETLERVFPRIQIMLEELDTKRLGVGCREMTKALAGHHLIPTSEWRLRHPSTRRST